MKDKKTEYISEHQKPTEVEVRRALWLADLKLRVTHLKERVEMNERIVRLNFIDISENMLSDFLSKVGDSAPFDTIREIEFFVQARVDLTVLTIQVREAANLARKCVIYDSLTLSMLENLFDESRKMANEANEYRAKVFRRITYGEENTY
jgi:hypothetical protein